MIRVTVRACMMEMESSNSLLLRRIFDASLPTTLHNIAIAAKKVKSFHSKQANCFQCFFHILNCGLHGFFVT
jgi:hypothetical protein